MDRTATVPQTLPDSLPVLSSEEMVLFPGALVGLQLEGAAAGAHEEIEKAGGLFIVARPLEGGLHPIGTLARVVEVGQGERGRALLVRALCRVRVLNILAREPVLMASAELMPALVSPNTPEVQALVLEAKRLAREILALLPNVPAALGAELEAIHDANALADLLAFRVPAPAADKQRMLEELDVEQRLKLVVGQLATRRQMVSISADIDSSVRKNLGRAERDHMLRQRRKAIEKELLSLDGVEDDESNGADALREKLAKLELPEEARTLVDRELKRLGQVPEASPERGISHTWLSWIADMPWSKTSEDTLDVAAARQLLDDDHEGLEKVKTRIGQFLAVRSLKGDMKGPILCFVGPPGVGKTSLGQSIAKAMGRKFVRVSLGGVRDEAEIRGHRRTYVGALPGRIVQAMKRAGTSNPVVMLDEIDKLGDGSGNPAAALLEVLDPEQNKAFVDHYLEVPIDLSRVLFIATANTLETVPAPLRDRMEMLELPGYALEEKLRISRTHLWPKQVEAHGLTGARVAIGDEALRTIIEGYTREAGVRSLERRIAAVCRHLAVEHASNLLGEPADRFVAETEIESLLGPASFTPELVERTQIPGVVAGLAWTPAGGELLFVEATEMQGHGKVIITGQLGDVMRESVHAALSYLRAHALDYGLPADPLTERDLHLHVPSGGTPKDGPSAGVTIFTALVSLLTGIRVRADVAMTGETTLRGRVLPVGGIKEKVLAAHRAGVKRMILPARCESDLREVPESVRRELEVIFVERLDQVLDAALEKSPRAPREGTPTAVPRPELPPVPVLRAA